MERIIFTDHALKRASKRLKMSTQEAEKYLRSQASGRKVGWFLVETRGKRAGEIRTDLGTMIVGDPDDQKGGLVVITFINNPLKPRQVQKAFPKPYKE